MKTIFSSTLTIVFLLFSAMNGFTQSSTVTSKQNHDSLGIKKRIIGFGFFAPLNSHLEFSYEQAFKNQFSFEAALGIIGPGVDNSDRHPGGVYVKVGPKLYFSPDWMMDGMYRFNDLQGMYFKPEIILNYYSALNTVEYYNYSNEERKNYLAVALMLNLGRQWVIAKTLSLDIHFGFGYGAGGDTDNVNQYSHFGGGVAAFAMSGGVTIGIPMK